MSRKIPSLHDGRHHHRHGRDLQPPGKLCEISSAEEGLNNMVWSVPDEAHE